jgi:prepilin peptidase CpaA
MSTKKKGGEYNGNIGLKWMLHACLTAAAVSDWKTGKIPNVLTGITALTGCGYFLAAGIGLEAGGAAVRGTAILLCLFPLHLFRMIGAGDIKMMACMGFFLNVREWLQVMLGAFVLAGCWSVQEMWRKELAGKRIRYLLFYVHRFLRTGERIPYGTDGMDPSALLCLGPFLWAGLTIFLMGEGAG